ncbi:triple gene block protein 3 [Banana mild mosaic virus]|uniref:Movement protein TGB2 n=1 Tax=Banana mild mosaic virus TaxID=148879 RepID=Q993S5_9VIRU|nr:triple gene block protein 3 [Banmivirus BanMMV]AAK28491.1 triple gene block protein 3 [Banmivirus BanMMV]
MALSRPPDYTKVLLVSSLAVGTAIIIHFLRRSELPHVGDNLHHLPYGGSYCDGTKRINYGGSHNKHSLITFNPLLLVFILSALIYVLSKRDSMSVGVHNCGAGCHVHIRRNR